MIQASAGAIRDRVDVSEVARRLMGDPTGRDGRVSDGRRLWWRCPFHDDRNPSFCIEAGKPWWRCFGCGAHGDAIALVQLVRRLTFPEALSFLSGGPSGGDRPRRPRKPPASATRPVSLPSADEEARQARMLGLVVEAERRLWEPEGRRSLEALRARGLDDATIRIARLGYADPFPGSRFRGIVVPWFSSTGVELVKIRQPRGVEPRYAEIYRRRPTVYPPTPLAYLPDHGDVVVVEGEFDALVLGQALASLATVITTGSASSRPDDEVLRQLDLSLRVFVATDADDAGDRCASWWPKRARRVRPPAPHKDWTEAQQAGIDLRRWWLPQFFADPYDFEERAAILESEAGYGRPVAELLAARELRARL